MARLKLPERGNRLAVVSIVVVMVTTAGALVALGGWGGFRVLPPQAQAAAGVAARVACPACPACPECNATCNATAAAADAVQQQPQPQPQQPAQPPQAAQQQPPQQAAEAAVHPDGAELFCGGPHAVPLVQEALRNATEHLYPAAAAAFQPWQEGFNETHIDATAEMLGADRQTADIQMLATVRGGKLVFPRQKDVCPGCNPAVFLLKEGMDAGLAAGRLRVPEGLPLLLNVNDMSWCRQRGGGSSCAAPLFSIFKDKRDLDVLMPHFKPRDLDLRWVPWGQKRAQAFFRGASICSWVPLGGDTSQAPSRNCSRWAVAQLSWEHPDLLNCTIMHNVTQYDGPPHVEGPPVSHEEQAWFRYLVNADGSTAAWRLATLLMKNSLVIKQASHYIEWYYHVVRHCVHYLHYWVRHETDLVQIVRDLNASPVNQLTAQRIAANGQAFAAAHLGAEAQWAYWQALVDRYLQLYRGPAVAPGGNWSTTHFFGGPRGGGQQAPAVAQQRPEGDGQQQPNEAKGQPAGGSKPAEVQQQPAAAETQPAEAKEPTAETKPAEAKEERAQAKEQPAVADEQPAGEDKPAAGEDKPAAAEEQPEGDQPAGEDKPAEEEEQPAGEDKPAAEEDKPAAAEEQPAGEDKPAAEEDKPAAAEEHSAGEDKPAAEEDKTAAAEEQPAGEDKPAAEGEQPAAEEKLAAAEEQPAEGEQPAAAGREPAADAQPEASAPAA